MNIFRPSKPKWSSGLFGCSNDCGTCLITCCLPCVTFGRIAEILEEGRHSCLCMGLGYCCLMLLQFHWIWSCLYREKMRAKFGLQEEPCCDCCVHVCCESCALCQEHAELKSRGYDPAKGYVGTRVFPPRPGSMFR